MLQHFVAEDSKQETMIDQVCVVYLCVSVCMCV